MNPVNVMIVDDDALVFFLSTKLINAISIPTKLIQCTDGMEAISYFKDNIAVPDQLPDVVFLDLSMPIMDGWEFLDEYRTIMSDLTKPNRLYVLSSSVSPHDMERAKQYDFVRDFIVKPLSRDLTTKILTEVANS